MKLAVAISLAALISVGHLSLAKKRRGSFEARRSDLYCSTCTTALIGTSFLGEIKALAKLLGPSTEVVAGLLDRFEGEVEYIIRRTRLSANDICATILPEFKCKPESALFEWQVDLPPPPRRPTVATNDLPKRLLKVVQIADVHLDPDYMPGSNAKCANGLFCCRAKYGMLPEGHPDAAGRWGTYSSCDASPDLLVSMLEHIKRRHQDIDYIMLTGDNAPHDVHETVRSRVLGINLAMTDLLRRQFPEVLMLPALGNHDAHPLNSIPALEVPHRFSNSWLIDPLKDSWRSLVGGSIPDSDGQTDSFNETFVPNAFYYVRIASLGLRFIVLNTNVCYRFNFWTLLAVRDPGGQLRWLVQQLLEAEQLQEWVHIIGHISPGDADCRFDWSRQYSRIVSRFRDTIRAQFFSHTHLDEFQVATDERGEPVSIVYIAPSVTTWTDLNPGYRVYYVDSDNGDVVDMERWYVDLDEANRSPDTEPQWRRLYSAREVYDMSDLRPTSWLRLAQRISNDEGEFNRLYRNYWGSSTRRGPCNNQCREQVLCNILTFNRGNLGVCEKTV